MKYTLYCAMCLISIFLLACVASESRLIRYSEAAAMVAGSGESPAGAESLGVSELPDGYEDLSVDGRVYITNLEGSTVYLFPIFYGKACNFHGVLYAPNQTMEIGRELHLNARLPRGIGEVEATVTDLIDEGLYAVSTDFLD